jgi:hypothetical protein
MTQNLDIWFADGDIVIQAENTQFRVYKGTLCNASEVLKEAVENIGDSKGMKGFPLLCLSDSSVDVAYVFKTSFTAGNLNLLISTDLFCQVLATEAEIRNPTPV